MDRCESAAICVNGLSKRFALRGWLPGRPRGFVVALNGASLSVSRGSIHGIIGPNGSGKSTLLRVLATLVIADSGEAMVAGCDVVKDPLEIRRRIGFSTGEERSVYWRLTARQNLNFAAALYRLPDAGLRVESALRWAGLLDSADRPVSGFSQGMARRLGLARSMLHEPSVLLLDEPTRSVDPAARDELHRTMCALREAGTTILLTTHDLAEAASLCDEINVLHAGSVVRHLVSASEDDLRDQLRGALP